LGPTEDEKGPRAARRKEIQGRASVVMIGMWQTISGLVKLIHPSPGGVSPEEVSDEVLRWAAWLGLKMRLRVRAQQHRLQSEESEGGEFGFRVGDGNRITPVRLREEKARPAP